MLKDYKVFNDTNVDVKLYDKIFNYLENEFKNNKNEVEKYPNKIKINNKEIEYEILSVESNSTHMFINNIKCFFEDDFFNFILEFNESDNGYFSHSMEFFKKENDFLYDLRSVLFSKNDRESNLEIKFNNYQKKENVEEYEYEKIVEFKIQKVLNGGKYKDNFISVLSGFETRSIKLNNRRLDFDEMTKLINDFIKNKNIEEIDNYKTKLSENAFDKRIYNRDIEQNKILLKEKLNVLNSEVFVRAVLEKIFKTDNIDYFFDIKNYIEKGKCFFNIKDPRIVITTNYYISSPPKVEIKIYDHNKTYDITPDRVDINKKNMSISDFKNLDFTAYKNKFETIEYIAIESFSRNNNLFSVGKKYIGDNYNKLLNDIIKKFSLEVNELKEVAYLNSEIIEILELESLENDNTIAKDLRRPFELLEKEIRVKEKKEIKSINNKIK